MQHIMDSTEETIDNTKNYVFFWSTGSPFSNWHPAKYTYKGIEFNCSEQGVMWSKAKLFGDDDIAEKILNCHSDQQKKMKDLGRKVKNFKDNMWHKNKVKIYTEHCYEKFTQNNELQEKLLSTYPKKLVEASPNDLIWGIGLHESQAKTIDPTKWPGKNLLGQILTNIRDTIYETNGNQLI